MTQIIVKLLLLFRHLMFWESQTENVMSFNGMTEKKAQAKIIKSMVKSK